MGPCVRQAYGWVKDSDNRWRPCDKNTALAFDPWPVKDCYRDIRQ